MAGHSKWANIKHRKGRQDAKRSRLWSKCSRAIIVAARNGGGDPDANLALRYAIDEAKAQNMPKDTIENAIKKGTGDVEGVNYESIVYEGYGPAGVAVLIECLTDNKNRTVPEMRKLFEKSGGNLGTTGSVAFNFEHKGEIYVTGADEEKVMEVALEAGAEDIESEGEGEEATVRVVCEPTDFMAVRGALEGAGMTLASAEVTMIPVNMVACTGRDAEKVLAFIDAVEDHDDVQKVHANHDIEDEELARLEA